MPASWIGRQQEIEIGHMSGASNVLHYLRAHGLPDTQDVVQAVLAVAKKAESVLAEDEVLDAIKKAGVPLR